jgi:hypothetical protein
VQFRKDLSHQRESLPYRIRDGDRDRKCTSFRNSLCTTTCGCSSRWRRRHSPAERGSSTRVNNYGRLPLAFVENTGQTDQQVRYYAQGNRFGFFLTQREVMLAFAGKDAEAGTALALRFIDANPTRRSKAESGRPGRSIICKATTRPRGARTCRAMRRRFITSSGQESICTCTNSRECSSTSFTSSLVPGRRTSAWRTRAPQSSHSMNRARC